jgi:uncharacterized protein
MAIVDTLDLESLRLEAGESRQFDLQVRIASLALGGQEYEVSPVPTPVRLDVTRMTGRGYSLRLRLTATLDGPCMRCLEPATAEFTAQAREVYQPGEDEELDSPYVDDAGLDVTAWANDTLVLALPTAILCKPDCLGLCPECGENLNTAGPEHHHEAPIDPRWSKLSQLHLD